MGVIFIPLWGGKDGIREIAWIGPIENLHAVSRKTANLTDKRIVMKKQNNSCNFCSSKITIGNFDADFDHIIPLGLGGNNTISNYQFLCVSCHRKKTAMENKNNLKIIDMESPGKREICIIYSDNIVKDRPYNMRTPSEIIHERGEDVFILSYSNRRKGYNSTVETDPENIFDKFRYIPD